MAEPDESAPLACSLSGADAGTRQAEWDALVGRAVVTRSQVTGGMRVTLAPRPGVREELERLVAAERECCPFLDLRVDDSAGALALTVTAPPDAAPLIEALLGG